MFSPDAPSRNRQLAHLTVAHPFRFRCRVRHTGSDFDRATYARAPGSGFGPHHPFDLVSGSPGRTLRADRSKSRLLARSISVSQHRSRPPSILARRPSPHPYGRSSSQAQINTCSSRLRDVSLPFGNVSFSSVAFFSSPRTHCVLQPRTLVELSNLTLRKRTASLHPGALHRRHLVKFEPRSVNQG